MSVQSTYSTSPSEGYAGQFADDRFHDVVSAVASAALSAGLAIAVATDERQVRPIATTDAVASAVNSIVTTHASVAGALTVSGSGLNGTIGAGEMWPPRQVQIVLSSHADWDATNVVVNYIDDDNQAVAETLAIPNGGNATLTTAGFARRVVSLVFDAQSGTGGSFTVGHGSLLGPCQRLLAGLSKYEDTKIPGQYLQYESVPTIRQGRVFVLAEGAVKKGDRAWVRFVSDGGSNTTLGTVAAAQDAGKNAQWKGARFHKTTSAAGLTILELTGVT